MLCNSTRSADEHCDPAGGSAKDLLAQSSTASWQVVQELVPYLPALASEILPEVRMKFGLVHALIGKHSQTATVLAKSHAQRA